MISNTKSMFIGPSDWVCSMAHKSLIGSNKKAFSVSNIISEEFFDYDKKQGVDDKNRFRILFGVFKGRLNLQKGYSDLEKALELLPLNIKENLSLVIYGEDSEPCLTSGVQTSFRGNITSVKEMVDVLNNADVFAFPSRAETQGMTKVEALLCGVPVVAFNRTACAEGIFHSVNGWIAEDGDINSFAEGIKYFYNMWESNELDKIKYQIQAAAKSSYSESGIVEKIIHEYEGLTKE